jgi:hypothetical protein
LRTYFDNLTADIAQPKAANQPSVGTSTSSAESTAMVGVTQNPSNAAPVYDQSQGVVADQNGNPVGPTAISNTATSDQPTQAAAAKPQNPLKSYDAQSVSVDQPFDLNPQAPAPATPDQFATDVQQVAADREHAGVVSEDHGGENEAAKVLIEENATDIETNKAIIDQNSRLRNSKGQFTSNPLSDSQLEESAKANAVQKEVGFELFKFDLFSTKTAVPLTDVTTFQVPGGEVQFGVIAETQTKVGGAFDLNDKGLTFNLTGFTKSALVYSQGEISNPDIGTLSYSVDSNAQAGAQAHANITQGGPLGYKVDVGGTASAQAVALQGTLKGETPTFDIPLTGGILQIKAEGQVQGNALAIGGSIGGGVTTTGTGIRVTEEAGASALFGINEKTTVDISINTQAALQVYNNAVSTAATAYNSTVQAVQAVQNYWSNVYNKLTH